MRWSCTYLHEELRCNQPKAHQSLVARELEEIQSSENTNEQAVFVLWRSLRGPVRSQRIVRVAGTSGAPDRPELFKVGWNPTSIQR